MSIAAAPSASAAPTFSVRVVLALIAVGVVAFAGFLVLTAYAPDLRSGEGDGGANALSRSAVGYAALAELLEADGVPTVVSRSERPPSSGLWVLTLEPGSAPGDLLDARPAVTTLVVMPKWTAQPDPRRPGWVRNAGLVPEATLARLFERIYAGTGGAPVEPEAGADPAKPEAGAAFIARRERAGAVSLYDESGMLPDGVVSFSRIDRLQTIEDARLTPVITDEDGAVVLGRLLGTRVHAYVLADPDLLNTQGLRSLADARSAVRLVRSLADGQGVAFDGTLHGYARGRTLLRAAFEPPFLAATLCLTAAALLMGFHAAVRFGPVARASRVFALGKTALADNAAGLIALAGREARYLPAYAADTRTAVAREIGAPRELAGEALDAFLDRIGGTLSVTESWSALNGQAHAAHNADGAAEVAARLHRWRTEMTHGRR